MARCDLTLATGGAAMVKAAYSSGKPAFGVGGGNSTMVIDETADIADAARNARLSKTSDFGSGCSADGNLLIDDRSYDAMIAQLRTEGGHLATAEQKALLERAMWDDDGTRIVATVAQPAPSSPPPPASPSPTTAPSSSSSRTRSARSTGSRARSSPPCWPSTATTASTMLWPRSARSTRSPARATPAASTPSTTTTSTLSPGWRR